MKRIMILATAVLCLSIWSCKDDTDSSSESKAPKDAEISEASVSDAQAPGEAGVMGEPKPDSSSGGVDIGSDIPVVVPDVAPVVVDMSPDGL